MKFHISSDGEVRPCGADKIPCRLIQHFDSQEEAERAYEAINQNQLFKVFERGVHRSVDDSRLADAAAGKAPARMPKPRVATEKEVVRTLAEVESNLYYVSRQCEFSGYRPEYFEDRFTVPDAPGISFDEELILQRWRSGSWESVRSACLNPAAKTLGIAPILLLDKVKAEMKRDSRILSVTGDYLDEYEGNTKVAEGIARKRFWDGSYL